MQWKTEDVTVTVEKKAPVSEDFALETALHLMAEAYRDDYGPDATQEVLRKLVAYWGR